MRTFAIRDYQTSDHAYVVHLHIIALKNIAAYAAIERGEWDKDLNDIESNYLKKHGAFLVGIIDKKIIAMGALRKITDDIVEIKRMRVDPEFQRKGFGQRMLDALEKRAKELGYMEIQLDTTVKETGQNLYRKNGYTEFKREKEGREFEYIFFQKKL